MKIVRLEAESFKRLRAVEITPDGNVVTITGKNGAGKSSVLDAIEAALGGVRRAPAIPIRAGEEKARIVCELDDIIVTRTFTQKGSSLRVEAQDGAKYPRPQEMLDRLVGELSFDPLAFSRMEPKDQRSMLERLTGVNMVGIDIETMKAEKERLDAGRAVKALELQGLPALHDDAPEEEVDVEGLVLQLRSARAAHDGADRITRKIDDAIKRCEHIERAVNELLSEEKHLNERIAILTEEKPDLVDLPDIEGIETELGTAATTNRKVAENRMISKHLAAIEEAEQALRKSSKAVEALRTKRRDAISNAVYPVDGLGFSSSGVTFNGMPFDQLSSAEQLRVSVAMGMALNPDLRVLLIRDGSLLDSESLALLGEMAAATDSQVWLERVSDGERVGIVIEDGAISEGGAA